MRIAFVDTPPSGWNKSHWKAFLDIVAQVCECAGVQCGVVSRSEHIINRGFDLVIISSPLARKLTEIPTIGLVFDDIQTFEENVDQRRNIFSLDGYICANLSQREYLDDIQCGISMEKPISSLYIPETLAKILRNTIVVDSERTQVREEIQTLIAEIVPSIYKKTLEAGCFSKDAGDVIAVSTPLIEVIIRAGSRSIDLLRRAIGSLQAANSTTAPLGVIVVDHASRADIEHYVKASFSEDLPIRYKGLNDDGLRSTSLWGGLTEVKAAYVAVLDDDDEIFANHYRTLVDGFAKFPYLNFIYSGAIRVEEEDLAADVDHEVAENRKLYFLEPFNIERLLRLENYIQSNAWLARTAFVKSMMGPDPKMQVGGGFYLYILLASRGPFGFTGSATAIWNWRSRTADNSILSVSEGTFAAAAVRIRRRLQNVFFAAEAALLKPKERDPSCPSDGHDGHFGALDYGDDVIGGFALAEKLALTGFHAPDEFGIWAGLGPFQVEIHLSEAVRQEGCSLRLTLRTASNNPSNTISLSVENRLCFGSEVASWEDIEVTIPIRPSSPSRTTLLIAVRDVWQPSPESSETRILSVLLRSLGVDRPNREALVQYV